MKFIAGEDIKAGSLIFLKDGKVFTHKKTLREIEYEHSLAGGFIPFYPDGKPRPMIPLNDEESSANDA